MRCILLVALAGCAMGGGDDSASTADELKLPDAISRGELTLRLDRPTIRAMQPWLTDAQFATKWANMLVSPIDFLGSASSSYHADLGTLAAARLPGDEVLCHGDPKIDNFGWTHVDGDAIFSDNDFDDAGPCPVAADALRYLLATDLAFADEDLSDAALEAYVDTVIDADDATEIDRDTKPDWGDLRDDGVDKATHGDAIAIEDDIQAATSGEKTAVRAMFAADHRLAGTIVDIARDVRTTGGSAGLRRFWVLVDASHRTIIELKELGTPATEAGRHTATLDGPDRFDELQAFWWGETTDADHFSVTLLGRRFLARDRFLRQNVKAEDLSASQLKNAVKAEASILALAHRSAWHGVKRTKLTAWLRASTGALVGKWRDAYTAAGGE